LGSERDIAAASAAARALGGSRPSAAPRRWC
jgi:hypothetical protein